MSELIRYWLRGSSWYHNSSNCRSTNCMYVTPDIRVSPRGFRIVRGDGK